MMTALLRTLLVYITVIGAMRLMGKRQLGELQPTELVTALLVSNVASICIEEPDLPFLASITPIFLITSLEILSSTLAFYCPRYADILFGKPVTVVRNGQVDQEALRYLRISAADLAEALRGKDIFTPGDVAWGLIEPNGSLSAAPMPQSGEDPVMLPLLIDNEIYHDNLVALHLDENWLDGFLQKQNLTRNQVLMLFYNGKESFLASKENRPGTKTGAGHSK